MADLRITVQEIMEQGNGYVMVMEKALDISDEELLRIGKRVLELTADMRGKE